MAKESDVQFAICEYLALRRRCFWRSNNLPAFNRNTDGSITMRKLPKHTPRGLADIFVVAGGVLFALEVKRPKELGKTYQSKEQREFQRLVEAHGGKYHVVRCIEDVQAAGL